MKTSTCMFLAFMVFNYVYAESSSKDVQNYSSELKQDVQDNMEIEMKSLSDENPLSEISAEVTPLFRASLMQLNTARTLLLPKFSRAFQKIIRIIIRLLRYPFLIGCKIIRFLFRLTLFWPIRIMWKMTMYIIRLIVKLFHLIVFKSAPFTSRIIPDNMATRLIPPRLYIDN